MRKKIKKITTFLALLSLPYYSKADVIITNPLGVNTFWDLLNVITSWLIYIGAPIATGMIIFAGFQYMSAGGDENKIKQASNTLTYAIVGFIIILVAKGLALAIKDLLGG